MSLAYEIEKETNTRELQWIEKDQHGVYIGIDRDKKEVQRVFEIIRIEAQNWFCKEFGYFPAIRIEISPRLSNANGRFARVIDRYSGETLDVYIQMAGRFMRHCHITSLLKTLKHELVHYHLWNKGKDFKDGQPTFEKMIEHYELPSNITGKNKCHPWYYETNTYRNYKATDSITRVEDY